MTSTRDNCLGVHCEEFARCHVALARRAAQEADVVIVNHHLLLADLVLKEDGFGDILGSADALIIDEAHQLPDLATQFLGASVSSRRIESVLKGVRIELDAARAGEELRTARCRRGAGGARGELARHLTHELPPVLARTAWSELPAQFGDTTVQLAAGAAAS